ncbi:HAD family hydrolase [Bacillus sp. Bva_UNVM-123]|uniref:HAD family hydrolase n=1 Tax=Bacillus sp. Bva_UNVM-123 TaxID=2829798 RepID=UPI00391FAE27
MKAVLFDLDGTLLDRDESIKSFIAKQYERFKIYFNHIKKEMYCKRFIELDHHGYVWKDKVYEQLIDEFDIKGISHEQLLHDYLEQFKYHCIAFSNLYEMLEKLKDMNIVLGIITNGKGPFQLDNVKALNIEMYFDVILVSELEGIKKPHPLIFSRALERLNVSPSECIFVGDHPENDVIAAQSVGMVGVWKKNDHWSGVKADYVIDDLGELSLIIRDLYNKVSNKFL